MKKILIALIVLGILVWGVAISNADSTRTTPHKFRAFTEDTEGVQSMTIYRITGYNTGANSVYAIHNVATSEATSASNAVVEGGEATSGDALPMLYFGEEGINVDTATTVHVYNCVIVLEYL